MTINSSDLKSYYLKSLYGIKVLTTEEEHELARKIQEGDDDALEKLVTHNLRFVPHVVTKMTAWQHSKMPMEDILAIGNEMLLIAAKRWKPYKDVPFAGYARPERLALNLPVLKPPLQYEYQCGLTKGQKFWHDSG